MPPQSSCLPGAPEHGLTWKQEELLGGATLGGASPRPSDWRPGGKRGGGPGEAPWGWAQRGERCSSAPGKPRWPGAPAAAQAWVESLSQLPETVSPGDTLISDFWLPELRNIVSALNLGPVVTTLPWPPGSKTPSWKLHRAQGPGPSGGVAVVTSPPAFPSKGPSPSHSC